MGFPSGGCWNRTNFCGSSDRRDDHIRETSMNEIPRTKLQCPRNVQFRNHKRLTFALCSLSLGLWDFLGHCDLVIGISHQVPRGGFEPAVAGLKGRHPEPLEERGAYSLHGSQLSTLNFDFTGTSGIRTHTHRGLSSAAIPVRVPCRCSSDLDCPAPFFCPLSFCQPSLNHALRDRKMRDRKMKAVPDFHQRVPGGI